MKRLVVVLLVVVNSMLAAPQASREEADLYVLCDAEGKPLATGSTDVGLKKTAQSLGIQGAYVIKGSECRSGFALYDETNKVRAVSSMKKALKEAAIANNIKLTSKSIMVGVIPSTENDKKCCLCDGRGVKWMESTEVVFLTNAARRLKDEMGGETYVLHGTSCVSVLRKKAQA